VYDFGSEVLWQPIDPISIGSYDVIPAAAERFTELMSSMTPEKLGQITPYIDIHEVNDDGSLGRKISADMNKPPRFGQSLDFRFSERPDVSIENVKVKTVMPQGWILYRELDLQVTVHRPDVVFSPSTTSSLIQSLLDPTRSHVLVYGWSGQQTVLAAGMPSEAKDTLKVSSGQQSWRGTGVPGGQGYGTDKQTDQPAVDYRQVMPTKSTIRFKVTHYNFSILPDMQVKFQIHAFEDGEVASRDAVIFNNRHILPLFDGDFALSDADVLFNKAIEYFNDQVNQKVVTVPIYVSDDKTKQTVKQSAQFITVLDLFNVFFADPLVFAARQLKYKTVRLLLGLFNENCPKTTATRLHPLPMQGALVIPRSS
jgi:hypothetical protein